MNRHAAVYCLGKPFLFRSKRLIALAEISLKTWRETFETAGDLVYINMPSRSKVS
jgi:hypothetical protein